MMKNLLIICICAILGGLSMACGNKQTESSPEGPEETITIAADHIQLSGKHSYLIKTAGDAQVMLTNCNKGEWEIEFYLPLNNTQTWDQWKSATPSDTDYDAAMSKIEVQFLKADGSLLDYKLEHNEDNIESLLSAEEISTENFFVKTYATGTYTEMKSIFSQIKGISISNMELDQIERTPETQSLGEDENLIDFDGIRENAQEEYKKAVENGKD